MKRYLLILLCPILGFSQISFDKVNEKTRKIAARYLERENIPGMAISISYNDTIIFSEGFGYADLKNKIPVVSSDTEFNIASITKTITVASLAKLIEKDSIDLDKSVYFYLNNLPKKTFDFSVRQLAGHLSGFERNPQSDNYSSVANITKKNFYEVFRKEQQQFMPSRKFSYSNLGYKILGLIIEEKSAKELTIFQKEQVLDKLRMIHTKKDSVGYIGDNVSKLYSSDKNNFDEVKNISSEFRYAECSYLSTSEDLIKLGNGFLYPNRILKKETLISLITSQKTIDGQKTNYGIGFNSLKDQNGNFYYGHDGSWIGSRSFMHIYPNSKLVVVVLANRSINGEMKYEDFADLAKNYIDILKK